MINLSIIAYKLTGWISFAVLQGHSFKAYQSARLYPKGLSQTASWLNMITALKVVFVAVIIYMALKGVLVLVMNKDDEDKEDDEGVFDENGFNHHPPSKRRNRKKF